MSTEKGPRFVASSHATSTTKYAQQITTHGHTLTADEPAALGGSDTGPAPYGLLVSALGACTSITLRMYAEKKGWELGTIRVDLRLFKEADERDRIERTIRVSAPLTDEQREKLLAICEKTPVTRTLRAGVEIATQLEPTAP